MGFGGEYGRGAVEDVVRALIESMVLGVSSGVLVESEVDMVGSVVRNMVMRLFKM